jgi:hypothetical protein
MCSAMFTFFGGKPESNSTLGILDPGVIAAKAAEDPPKLPADAVEAVKAAKMVKNFMVVIVFKHENYECEVTNSDWNSGT